MNKYKVLNIDGDKVVDVMLSSTIIIDNGEKLKPFIDDELSANTNPIIDSETIIFDPKNTNYLSLVSCLGTGLTYFQNYTNNLFSSSVISSYSDLFIKSFFLLDFYDTDDLNKQTNIYSTRIYLRPVIKKVINPVTRLSSNIINDTILVNYESVFIPIPSYSITNGLSSVYMRVRFFDASKGLVYFFKNSNNNILNKINLDIVNNEWFFDSVYYNQLMEYKDTNELNQIVNKDNAVSNNMKFNESGNSDYISVDGTYIKII